MKPLRQLFLRFLTKAAYGKPQVRSLAGSKVEFFRQEFGSKRYFVCFDQRYLFEANSDDPTPMWREATFENERWEDLYQWIYWAGRAETVEAAELPATLPPIPEALAPCPPQAPNRTYLASDYPELGNYLDRCEGRALAVYLVLWEDRYETFNGDGTFRYPRGLCFNPQRAYEYKSGDNRDNLYHVRPGLLWRNLTNLYCQMPNQPFDQFKPDHVMRMAEAALLELRATAA